jgi:hypothetical protein
MWQAHALFPALDHDHMHWSISSLCQLALVAGITGRLVIPFYHNVGY